MRTAASAITLAFLLYNCLSANAVMISEFMADNQTGIRDAEGDRSDWIEIENPGADEVNLDGWSLTTDSQNPRQWIFPAVKLPAGGRLLVFASGKDRRRVDAELHTNFQLSNQGEFLGLIRPDGVTLEHGYSPVYPPQRPDIAYGIGASSKTITPVGVGSEIRWRVPKSGSEFPANWNSTNLDDSTWQTGRWPLGFDSVSLTNSAFTNLARGRTATQSTTFGSFGANLASDGNRSNYTHTLPGQGLPARWEINLTTTRLIHQVILYNRTDCCGDRLRDIQIQILGANSTTTNYISPLLNPENILNSPAQITLNLSNLIGGPILGSRVRVYRMPDLDLSGGGTTGDDAEVLSLAEVEIIGQSHPNSLDALVNTDVQGAMLGVNSTLLARQVFDDPTGGTAPWLSAQLRVRYEDGFVAYLNGQEIARRNAPATLLWNSTSTTNRSTAAAILHEIIPLPKAPGLAKREGNVLAIQSLNSSSSESDLLIHPVLEITTSTILSNQYLLPPTPGTANGIGYEGVLPQVEFSQVRGFYQTSFEVTLAVPGYDSQIYYTTNGTDPSPSRGILYTAPVPITRTTALRAAAFKPGFHPSESLSHTYLFVDDIIQQSRQVTASYGFPNTWGARASDYGMDQRVIGQSGSDTFGGKYAKSIRDDLRSIPSLAISIGVQDMFGPTGIYSQSEQHGDEFERSVSAELIQTNGTSAFQINAGLRIQGGAFRSDGLTKKQSLRLIFSSDHGPTKLRYPLFGPDASDSFDTLTLRANSNDGYSWDAAGPRALYARDSFGRETMLDMKNVASHHKFVHVYLNGIYWGLYEMVERPDASFSSTYYGGDKTEWDSLNSGVPTQGDTRAWDRMSAIAARGLTGNSNYFLLQGRNPDGTLNPALTNLLDVKNLADYMIVNLYMGNTDWPQKNYWVGRRKVESTGYKFYMWDAEWSMGLQSELTTDRTGITEGVAVPYAACKANAEFRQLFGDRVYRHFFNQGALAVDPQQQAWNPANPKANRAAERFFRITSEIERAMVAESARWGDMHASVSYTRDEGWAVERASLLKTYYPFRSDVVVDQFRKARLYPYLDPPTFSQRGGLAKPGDTLQLGASIGTIYYTTNGSDPRMVGGVISPSAFAYSGPIALPGRCQVKARTFLTNAWSAIDEAVFTQLTPYPLQLTELHWRPEPTAPDSPFFQDDSEFIELRNNSAASLNIAGASFTRGITFTFTNGPGSILAPGQRLVLVRNRAGFLARYGNSFAPLIAGQYEGTLFNAGERLTLLSPFSEVVFDFSYRPDWQPLTDGQGFSLVLRNEDGNEELENPSTWRCSTQRGGSPGEPDPTPITLTVVINEVLARPSGNRQDQIELANIGTAPADVSGWFLTDDAQVPRKFKLPPGSVIQPGAYLSVSESAFNPRPRTPEAFGLSAEGDSVHLYAADAQGNLLGYSDSLRFGASRTDQSFNRLTTSTGETWPVLASQPTFGSTNSPNATPPVMITEIHYAPVDGKASYIELKNVSDSPLLMGSASLTAQQWEISGIGFSFNTDLTLPAQGICIVSSVEPTLFRQQYQVIDPDVVVLGPFGGRLDAESETIELRAPQGPNASGVVQETVPYRSLAPWPTLAGSGASLQRRIGSGLDSVMPEAWVAAHPTPGTVTENAGTAPVITQDLRDVTLKTFEPLGLTLRVTSSTPVSYQWFKDGAILTGQTNQQLRIQSVVTEDAGVYQAIAFNLNGAVRSRSAGVRILKTPTITKVSPDRNLPTGTNVTLSVNAVGIGTLRYQWLKNGGAISGANGSTLTLQDLLPENSGAYQCAVTDPVGSTLTRAIQIVVAYKPIILEQPQPLVAVQGETAEFRLLTGGSVPMAFRWRRNSTVLTNQPIVSNDPVGYLRLTNVQPSQAGNYSVALSNASGITLNSANATLVVLADFDKDGMADVWEVANGFRTNSAADANQDLDKDGFTNLQEFQAGTDPKLADNAFKLLSIQEKSGVAEIRFNAISNKTYSILYRDQWTNGTWNKLIDVPNLPSSRLQTITDTVESNRSRFYQLITPRQP